MPSPPSHSLHNDRDHQPVQEALLQSRVSMSLLAALVACTAIVLVYSLVATPSAPIDEEKVLEIARKRVVDNSGEIAQEVASLASEALPPAATAFRRQLERDLPQYAQALEQQGDELLEAVTLELRKHLRDEAEDFLEQHRQVFRQEFPDVADERAINRMVRDYHETANRLMERYYLDDFRRQAERTARVWKTFEPVQPPAESTLEDLLIQYTGDWLALQARDAAAAQFLTEPEAVPTPTGSQ